MSFYVFIQQFFSGLFVGGVYALIAVGYTMVYAAIRVINFSNGDFIMVSSFLSLLFLGMLIGSLENINSIGFSQFFITSFFSLLFTGLIGALVFLLVFRPLLDKGSSRIHMLIAAISVSFFLESLFSVIANNFLGGNYQTFYFPEFLGEVLYIGDATLGWSDLILSFVSILLVLFLILLLKFHKLGLAIRALSYDIEMVELMGINTKLLIMLVFVIGAVYAGVGGIFYDIDYPNIDPYMGMFIGLKSFAAAVIGGIGEVSGALLGGLLLGLIEVLIPAFFPEASGWKDAFAFILLIFILIFKPTGILGKDFERQRF